MQKRYSVVRVISGLAVFVTLLALNSTPAAAFELQADIRLPAGFSIEQLAEVPNARAMAWGDEGTLFVATMTKGKVYAVSNILDGAAQVYPIGNKLKMPTGVAFRDGSLYVAETNRIIRFSGIEQSLNSPPEPVVVVDGLPGKRLHSWKVIDFGADGKLYVTVGSPCNVCDEPDYGLIVKMNPDGTEQEVVARGIRNSVGFAWHPRTGELWFSDNNRDMMGDDEPPGELNRVAVQGQHFGFPFCHGSDTVEPTVELAALGNCADATAPAQELGPHVVPLGILIYSGDMFPAAYQNHVFIAEHGSWNRSEKIGYRVSLVRLSQDGEQSLAYESFAEGWLDGDTVKGRPAGLLMAPDGSLLLSDDKRGAIYRISYTGN